PETRGQGPPRVVTRCTLRRVSYRVRNYRFLDFSRGLPGWSGGMKKGRRKPGGLHLTGWGGVLLDRTLVPPSFFTRQISLQLRSCYFAAFGGHHHSLSSKHSGLPQAG